MVCFIWGLSDDLCLKVCFSSTVSSTDTVQCTDAVQCTDCRDMGVQFVFDALIMLITQVAEEYISICTCTSKCPFHLQLIFFGGGWIFFLKKLFKNFEV